MNHRKKTKADGSQLIPQKHTETLVLLSIADDVTVYGKTLADHDKNLITVLDTLRESGLTVNEKQCKLRLPQLTFFGHDLNKRGIEPSEEKIAAIQDCEPPKTASEARSFMGLVQYSAKFIPDLASVARPIQDRPVTRGAKPPLEKFSPHLEKCVGHNLKILDIVQKIWVSIGKLFVPPGVPSWLGALFNTWPENKLTLFGGKSNSVLWIRLSR